MVTLHVDINILIVLHHYFFPLKVSWYGLISKLSFFKYCYQLYTCVNLALVYCILFSVVKTFISSSSLLTGTNTVGCECDCIFVLLSEWDC